MARYYPVLLRLEGMPCLVVGGGPVAEGKVLGLLACGARVTVVAPEVIPGLAERAARGELVWHPRPYREGDLEGFVLAIAATDNRELHGRIAQEARRRRVWLNAVDDPEHCTFILPAVYRQGDLVLAVSTSGKSPALAVRLRDRLGQQVGREYARFLELLGRLRPEVQARFPDPQERARVWYRLVDSPALELLRRGREKEAERLVRALAEGGS